MKTLRYLLIVMAMLSVLSVEAQYLAQCPEAQMKSTSVMVHSGSSLPQAAATGVYVTGSSPASYAPVASYRPGRIRKDVGGDGWADEDDTPGQGDVPPDLPGDTVPIGDGLLALMVMGGVYAMFAFFRRRKLSCSK